MFNIWVERSDLRGGIGRDQATTGDLKPTVNSVLSAEEIAFYQGLVRRIPVPDNVVEYAVKLVGPYAPRHVWLRRPW